MIGKKLLLLFFLVASAVSSASPRRPTSWDVPDYPPTTIENDGTHTNRYDVRKTLAYVANSTTNVNNIFMLYNIVTQGGLKYHLTTNLGLLANGRVGTFVSVNDLQNMTARGASILLPGSGQSDYLNINSPPQNMTGPMDGDRWTGTNHHVNIAGVTLKTTLRPTGGNFYYGGSGGISLVPRGTDDSYHKSIPGWSWYWANPTTRINGTITVDGVKHQIDQAKSFALFERQWGDFGIGNGYYALWFYLETGEVLIAWIMDPNIEGRGQIAFASIWHPNGLHEMIPVGPKTCAWDISLSNVTRYRYFNEFVLDLPARKASFRFSKWIRDAELIPELPEQLYTYSNISESYGEGTGLWNGKKVKFYGHVEQLSRLREANL